MWWSSVGSILQYKTVVISVLTTCKGMNSRVHSIEYSTMGARAFVSELPEKVISACGQSSQLRSILANRNPVVVGVSQ